MRSSKTRTTNNASKGSRMRKILPTLIALVALAASAQPAAADAPSTVTTNEYPGWHASTNCMTEWQWGEYGANGAWGDYIDGCTVARECPWARCMVEVNTIIETEERTGHRVTANMRVRSGSSFYDESCEGVDGCVIHSEWAYPIYQGTWVSVQGNGVRDENVSDSEQTEARIRCYVLLYNPEHYDRPPL